MYINIIKKKIFLMENFLVVEQFRGHKYLETSHYKALKVQPSFNYPKFGVGLLQTYQYK